MLETVREFALERLGLAGELEATRAAHVAALLRRLDGDWQPAEWELAEWDRGWGWSALSMPQLEQERENLRLALAWCAEHEDVERGLRLIVRATDLWRQAGPRSEGLAWLRRFLERAPAALPTWLRLQTLHSATLLAAGIGDLPAMGAYLAQALELAEAGPDRRVLVRVLALSAQGLLRVGDLPAARAASERLRALVQESPIGQEDEVGALITLGMAAHVGGDLAGAAAAYQEALAIPGRCATWATWRWMPDGRRKRRVASVRY